MEIKLNLFPHKMKYIGFMCLLLAFPFAYLYFWGGRPEFFNTKVFALITVYLETRYLVIAQTNILDELAAILVITGVALISFSKEKVELEVYTAMRVKAIVNSVFITLAIWVLCFLLIYGMAIILCSSLMFFVFLLSYNLIFRFYLFRERRRNVQANLIHEEIS